MTVLITLYCPVTAVGQGGEVRGHQSGLTRAVPAPRSITFVPRNRSSLNQRKIKLTMGNALTKEDRALLERAREMFDETGYVPGFDGEEVPAETMVPTAKDYILETINDTEAFYDREIWDMPGFTLVLSWL